MAFENIISKGKYCTILFPSQQFSDLHDHLYPGDDDEHAAVLLAGMHLRKNGEVRLLIRKTYLVEDGVDWVPSRSGRAYRQLNAPYIHQKLDECAEEQLIYLFVHNHHSDLRADFSQPDLNSHKRSYPSYLDILNGIPVGALVFGKRAVAGDIWLSKKRIIKVNKTIITGKKCFSLTPEPVKKKDSPDNMYDRQMRTFGIDAQSKLKHLNVGIVGLGGVGSIIAELLGRMGIGKFLLIDPDIVEKTNLPRLVGAQLSDLSVREMPFFWRKRARSKVELAKRNIIKANPKAKVRYLEQDVCESEATRELLECDYIFLAADKHSAKLLVNALSHQYLIPYSQIGSKIQKSDGKTTDIFTISRKIHPESGCLWCNGAINPAKLTDEGKSEQQLANENYGMDRNEPAPSLISLNAVSSSEAVNNFLFYILGITEQDCASGYRIFRPITREVEYQKPRSSANCPFCGDAPDSQFARGDAGKELPCKKK